MEKTIQDIQENDGIDIPGYGFNIAKVVREKAILIVVDTSSWINRSEKSIWIPKSLIEIWQTAPGKGIMNNEEGTVFYTKDLPQWFYEKNQIH